MLSLIELGEPTQAETVAYFQNIIRRKNTEIAQLNQAIQRCLTAESNAWEMVCNMEDKLIAAGIKP